MFIEELFPIEYAEGTKGGSNFNTVVVIAAASEQRAGLWVYPRRKWTIGSGPRSPQVMTQLTDFFDCLQGKLVGFRFLDVSNSTAVMELLANPGTTTLNLTKTYKTRWSSIVRTRKIVKPVAIGTVINDAYTLDPTIGFQLYKDGVLMVSGYTLDPTTGTVTLTTAAAGSVFRWSGTFHIPVRFDTDSMDLLQECVARQSWSSIPIIELHPDIFNAS